MQVSVRIYLARPGASGPGAVHAARPGLRGVQGRSALGTCRSWITARPGLIGGPWWSWCSAAARRTAASIVSFARPRARTAGTGSPGASPRPGTTAGGPAARGRRVAWRSITETATRNATYGVVAATWPRPWAGLGPQPGGSTRTMEAWHRARSTPRPRRPGGAGSPSQTRRRKRWRQAGLRGGQVRVHRLPINL